MDRFDLTEFLHVFNNEEMMGVWLMTDYDADVWGSCIVADEHSPDLVVVSARRGTDSFSKWVCDHAVHVFKKVYSRSRDARICSCLLPCKSSHIVGIKTEFHVLTATRSCSLGSSSRYTRGFEVIEP
jgi:hypothetical protein